MTLEVGDNPKTALHRSEILVRMNWAAGFAAVFGAITGSVLTRYGQTLGLSPFAFGVLAALPFFTAFVQLPASYLVERFGGRRWTAIFTVLIHRGLWLLVAAVPWLVPRAWWWLGLLAFVGLSQSVINYGSPAITSWAADLVPGRLRGRYYAVRGQLVRIITVPICLLAGWGMDRAQGHGGLVTLMHVLSLMLAIAGVVGMLDGVFCIKLPDPWHRPRGNSLPFREIFSRPFANRNFRYLLGYNGVMTFATGYISIFVWLYLIDVVHTSNAVATFMSMVGGALVSLFAMRVWGRLVDRWGCKRVMLFAGVLVINGASAWAFVTPGTLWTGYLLVMISSFGWPAMELAGGNLLYSMSETRRGEESLGSAFAAINSGVIAIAGTLSGLFGGWVAQSLKDWHGSIMGHPITFHVVLFIISGILRIVALLWIFGLQDDRRQCKMKNAKWKVI